MGRRERRWKERERQGGDLLVSVILGYASGFNSVEFQEYRPTKEISQLERL